MNERDDLNKQLEEAKQPKWIDSRLKALSKLPRAHRHQLKELLVHENAGFYYEKLNQTRTQNAAKLFDGIDETQRTRLFSGLFPSMAPHVERAWATCTERPYHHAYQRMPFRAPHRSAVLRQQRAQYFLALCASLQGYDPTPAWLAAWDSHMNMGDYRDPHAVSWLLATVLRSGGREADEVRSVIVDSINGEHEVGRMGPGAVATLLNSDERSDWEIIGKLLLAAQRQEGLRQYILETVSEAHPGAFRYMLGLILEHDLVRFSSVVQAFDVWLGYQWAGGSTKVVHKGLSKLCDFLDDEAVRTETIERGDGEDTYLALWATAHCDADQAIPAITRLISDDDPARRYAALAILSRIGLVPDIYEIPASRLLSGEETDERILTFICCHFAVIDYRSFDIRVSDELFDAVGDLFQRFPAKKKKLDSLIWPWDGFVRERRDAAQALSALACGNPKKLLPYAHALESYHCAQVVREISGTDTYWDQASQDCKERDRHQMDADERAFVVRMMADTRQFVHSAAFEALKESDVSPDEVNLLKDNLHRTAATFRRGAIDRLSRLPPEDILSLGEDLLDAKQPKKRMAALELLEPLANNKKLGKRVAEMLRQRQDSLKEVPELDAATKRVLASSADEVTLDDCLGLVPPGSRSTPIVPKARGVYRDTKIAKACLKSLAELFLKHSETEIEVNRDYFDYWIGNEKVRISSRFPRPRVRSAKLNVNTPKATLEHLPLHEVWTEWAENRGGGLRDADGLELIRAWALAHDRREAWKKLLPKPFHGSMSWELNFAFQNLIEWLPLLANRDDAFEYLVHRVEDSIANHEDQSEDEEHVLGLLSGSSKQAHDLKVAREYLSCIRGGVTSEQLKLWGQLSSLEMLAMDRGISGCDSGPTLEGFSIAYSQDLLNESDFIALLLNERFSLKAHGIRYRFGPIAEATGLKPHEALAQHPKLLACASRVRNRLIEIELTRGERSTVASDPVSEVRFAGGAEIMINLVTALGKDKIVRQDQWGEPTRSYSFSRLISVTMPQASDTDDHFSVLINEHRVKTPRLLEVGMYAPQWAGHIERATSLAGFEETVWWIHAHTKRNDYWRNTEIRDLWAAQINERTELDSEDLEEGAVDVAWFNRILTQTGEDAWRAFQKPAKYASNSGGHKRAQLFADAMLGRVGVDELMPRIDEKRNQDAVRALGLVPLPKNKRQADAETLARYNRLQDFKRESRKFGSQRQASEGRAVEIGMQNLARTAGYRDPRRLQWAMEAEAVADLAKGPVSVTAEETTVTLAIDKTGAPVLSVIKKGKKLKNVPAKHRKHPEIAELKTRVTDLRRQSARMRLSLEESMCRGDVFTGAELAELYAHPMLRPMVDRLVFVTDAGTNQSLAGYPDKQGKVLRNHTGQLEPIGKRDALRLAHPTDLFQRGDWHNWQRECFGTERIQPFKQVFRELYPCTKNERSGCSVSRRYAGHQVNPRQALALLKKKTWVFATEEGCRRVFHDEGLIAELSFQEHFYTPAEVDGLTLEGVAFRKKGANLNHIDLRQVPNRVFSETMRDLDLVVSVAHAGGVDPEASASTVEMRTTLLKETCQLLGLNNVRVEGHHAMIDGTRASYSIHLGSATTRVLPGRTLAIVAVHSQYRGRLFLPFADDDPRTAEVMAKALLLARDEEIKDPYILEQIGS